MVHLPWDTLGHFKVVLVLTLLTVFEGLVFFILITHGLLPFGGGVFETFHSPKSCFSLRIFGFFFFGSLFFSSSVLFLFFPGIKAALCWLNWPFLTNSSMEVPLSFKYFLEALLGSLTNSPLSSQTSKSMFECFFVKIHSITPFRDLWFWLVASQMTYKD